MLVSLLTVKMVCPDKGQVGVCECVFGLADRVCASCACVRERMDGGSGADNR